MKNDLNDAIELDAIEFDKGTYYATCIICVKSLKDDNKSNLLKKIHNEKWQYVEHEGLDGDGSEIGYECLSCQTSQNI